ncbi:MAG: hypothetical protein AAF235_07895 [Planctomycetota bacterium]
MTSDGEVCQAENCEVTVTHVGCVVAAMKAGRHVRVTRECESPKRWIMDLTWGGAVSAEDAARVVYELASGGSGRETAVKADGLEFRSDIPF